MFSRKYRCTLILSLALSAGALTLPPAEAAASRSDSPHAGSAVQTPLFTRSLIETVKNLWEMLKDVPAGPPSGHDPKPDNREGSGMCPIGNPHPGH